MKKLMDGILRRYGTTAKLSDPWGSQQVKVFFYSVNSTGWQNIQRVFSPLGEVPRGQYICVLSSDARAAAEDTLEIGGRAFLLRRVEPMGIMGETLYDWCVCVEKGGADIWGLNG